MASNWFASLPNMITVGRIALTPVVIWMIGAQHWSAALALFIVAGVSDAVDGWLAKTYHLESALGALLDPIADKALLVSIYGMLAMTGAAPLWVTLLIIGRDILIVLAVLLSWALSRPVEVRPHYTSKATTAAQLVLAALMLARPALGLQYGPIYDLAIGLVAALTVASACVYLWLWVKHMRPQNVAERSAVARRAQ